MGQTHRGRAVLSQAGQHKSYKKHGSYERVRGALFSVSHHSTCKAWSYPRWAYSMKSDPQPTLSYFSLPCSGTTAWTECDPALAFRAVASTFRVPRAPFLLGAGRRRSQLCGKCPKPGPAGEQTESLDGRTAIVASSDGIPKLVWTLRCGDVGDVTQSCSRYS